MLFHINEKNSQNEKKKKKEKKKKQQQAIENAREINRNNASELYI